MAINNAEDLRRCIEYQADVLSYRLECGGDINKVIDYYLDVVPRLHGRSWRVARRLSNLENMRRARELMASDDSFNGRVNQ